MVPTSTSSPIELACSVEGKRQAVSDSMLHKLEDTFCAEVSTDIWENGVDLRSLQFACPLGSFLQITGLHLICQGRVICNDFCNRQQATSAATRLSFLHTTLQKAQVQSLKQL